MLSNERIAELSVKAAKVARDITNDALGNLNLRELNYAKQQLIVLRNIWRILDDIAEYRRKGDKNA